ncbi:type II toxin-antitoxin system PemK/MazF family toxin [Limosilactobacillus fastidiosus]|uniref:Type II toxin-antitoxin system PemK/MazF family toxin n=1 Tax=Limosilactobacillus fastidiosus TaxID=2759855 RepID=A0ABR6E6N3_9LACO|nr:type II toxin-antitoxin system PemK/MazF family toxin [Limosilactobacillus fastidiosus]MBB1062858.1 type II toxin-antitoxin system PemK/MazF family toxin [Limosilactobacillus fastidiosus]MCD7084082.1 type II toxin-antitoxin system PemK/MazF family toxin [Limosilactobacillus fastidiosus]
MNKNARIDQACDRFKNIAVPTSYHYKQKFQFLPSWLDNTSYSYEKEAKGHNPKRYYSFKRGTVIRVNFGVNLGSEFSNIHFAIVLDKHDAPQKRTLTVLPLTSKQKSNRFSLGSEIFNQTTILLGNMKDRLSKLAKESTSNQNFESSNNIDKAIQELDQVVKLYERYNKQSYVRLSDITTISKLRIERLNKYDPSGKIRLSNAQMAQISHELMKLYLNK